MSNHISAIIAKAPQRANVILHCFVSQDHNLRVKAFKNRLKTKLVKSCYS